MKALFSELNSLLPHQSSREVISQPDQLDEARKYIKKLQMNLEKMKEKKDSLIGIENPNGSVNRGKVLGLKSPEIEIRQMGSALEVVMITGLDCQFMFNGIIRVLHEEGADIVQASYNVVEDAVFHTIHCEVGESSNRDAILSERLKRFLDGSDAF